MIFVTLGSQKFQFDRILKEIDFLIENGDIQDNVFAQIGYSNYIPRNFNYQKFLSREEFRKHMKQSEIVITHGGTGAIVGALKMKKKVIAVPRLEKYGEHVDNHQREIVKQFTISRYISGVEDIKNLKHALYKIENTEFKGFKSNTINIVNSIEAYIESRK